MKINNTWSKAGYVLRPARATEAEIYYERNFNPLDKEVARLTGSKEEFSKEEVISFFLKAIDDEDRCFFLLINSNWDIIGECVINEIDWGLKRANFRICIFRKTEWEKGIGTWAVEVVRDFAFEELKLHRLELEVFSFNPRAEKVYLKAGYKREGILRDAIFDGNKYADVILMAILEEEWRQIKDLG